MTASDQVLRSFVERIERLEEEARALNADKSEVYKEAKSVGLSLPALKAVIGIRRNREADPTGHAELNEIIDLYMRALDCDAGERPPRARARDEDDGPARRMWRARQVIFDALEDEGKIPGTDTSGTVYFLLAPDLNRVKIGVSRTPKRRILALTTQSPCELRLLATCPGGRKREMEIHAQFSALRTHGEWFEAAPELIEFGEKLGRAHTTPEPKPSRQEAYSAGDDGSPSEPSEPDPEPSASPAVAAADVRMAEGSQAASEISSYPEGPSNRDVSTGGEGCVNGVPSGCRSDQRESGGPRGANRDDEGMPDVPDFLRRWPGDRASQEASA